MPSTAVEPVTRGHDTYKLGKGAVARLQPGTMGWSIADLSDPDVYALWAENRYEIHDGVLVAMPLSLFDGGAAASNLSFILRSYLNGLHLDPVFAPGVDLEASPDRILRGDMVAVWGDVRTKFDSLVLPPPRSHWSEHPLRIPPTMVIESAKQGHEEFDRRIKRNWYAEFGVRHYWIVDSLRRTLDCLVLDGDRYRDEASGRDDDVIRPPSLVGLAIPLAEVWIR